MEILPANLANVKQELEKALLDNKRAPGGRHNMLFVWLDSSLICIAESLEVARDHAKRLMKTSNEEPGYSYSIPPSAIESQPDFVATLTGPTYEQPVFFANYDTLHCCCEGLMPLPTDAYIQTINGTDYLVSLNDKEGA